MPKENDEKTKSARSPNETIQGFSLRAGRGINPRLRLLFSLAAVVSIILTFIIVGVMSQNSTGPTAEIAGKNFALELADSPDEQVRGLSGRSSLAKDTGMLFVFAQSDIQCFWMKDMQISIDMVWLNEAGKVLHVENSASPMSYPKQFCPEEPSKYVLETNAGVMKSLDVEAGEQIELDLN